MIVLLCLYIYIYIYILYNCKDITTFFFFCDLRYQRRWGAQRAELLRRCAAANRLLLRRAPDLSQITPLPVAPQDVTQAAVYAGDDEDDDDGSDLTAWVDEQVAAVLGSPVVTESPDVVSFCKSYVRESSWFETEYQPITVTSLA